MMKIEVKNSSSRAVKIKVNIQSPEFMRYFEA